MCRLLDKTGKGQRWKFSVPFHSKKNEVVLEEITEEELYEGHTIASALNFKLLGLAVSMAQSGKEQFGTVKDLSPLGDMVDNEYFSTGPSILCLKREIVCLRILSSCP